MSATPDAIAAEWPFLVNFVRKRMSDDAAAEDIAAGVVERALRAADQFETRGDAPLRAWLVRIAKNAIADEARRNKGVSFYPLQETGRARLDAGSDSHATALDVRAAVSTLEPWQQRYCWLRGEGKDGRNAMFLAARITCKSLSFRQNRAVRSALAAALGVAS